MSDPDVRVVVEGIPAAERKIEQLHRQRRGVERMADEARRNLEKLDRQLRQIDDQLRSLGQVRG